MTDDEPDGGFWPYHHPIRRIERKLDLLLERQQTNMSATTNSLANLQAADALEAAAVNAEIALLNTLFADLQAASPTGDNPAIDAIVANMQSRVAALNAAAAADTPPATPTPTPTP